MPVTLTLKTELTSSIEVDGITPRRLVGLSSSEIGQQTIWHGRRQKPLSDFFSIDGTLETDQTIQWSGDLRRVHRIGQELDGGKVQIVGDAGHHVGFKMSTGRIEIQGDAANYLGAEMTGGTVTVTGNVASHAGGCFPGEKFGMNRGQIFIQGTAGSGLGQGMRRGTIVVAGAIGKLAGWNMLAGTIIGFGDCGQHPGAGMKRGTIVLAQQQAHANMRQHQRLLPTFQKGMNFTVPVLRQIKTWLATEMIAGQPIFDHSILARLDSSFQLLHGDQLRGGRGELYLASADH